MKRMILLLLLAALCCTAADATPCMMTGFNYIGSAMLFPIIAFVCGCSVPVFIVFFVFYFRHKNRKAKYRLAEQALASGQSLPADFFRSNDLVDDMRVKGFKNTFLGIGLFIFLLYLTDEPGIACIGVLVMCTGLGQLLIHYTQKDK